MAEHIFEFAILGAGALGSIVGAHLARSGHNVVMLSRGKRAQSIIDTGLRIKGLSEFSQRVSVLTDLSSFRGADVLIVATKTYDTKAALEPIRRATIGAALSIQNGVMKNGELHAVWGREHVLGALADTSGELLPTGEALFTRNAKLYIGELDGGVSTRAKNIAETIDRAGINASAVSDIESLEWSKFTGWVGMMVLSLTTRTMTWKYLVDPDAALVLTRIVREVGTLASACKIPLSDRSPLPVATILTSSDEESIAIIQDLGRKLKLTAPEHRMSSLQDLQAGRPLEIEETLGHAVHSAIELNLSVPLLRSFYLLVASISRIRG